MSVCFLVVVDVILLQGDRFEMPELKLFQGHADLSYSVSMVFAGKPV